MTDGASTTSVEPLRIAVIGAGALGAATTYRLAGRGCAVTLIDRASPGTGTTGSSFAWLNAFAKQPHHYHELNALSVRECASLSQEVGGDWLHMSGGLHWADPADEAGQQKLTTAVARLRAWDYPVETLSPQFVMRSLEPDLEFPRGCPHEIYRVPEEGWLHGPEMVQAVVAAATRRHGARLVRGRVVGLRSDSGDTCDVKLENGDTITVDLVVNAGGPAAREVAEMAGGHIPVGQAPGVLVVTRPCGSRIRHVIHAPEINVRPDQGDRLMLHSTDYDSLWKSADDPSCTALYDQPVNALASIAPSLAGCEVERVLVGVRPVPTDNLPVVGFDIGVPFMYHVVSHSAITLCALLSKLAADEICGSGSSLLEPYSLGRRTEVASR